MRERRVLMIQYNFPPYGGVASIRALGFASRLSEHGWSPVVIAPRSAPFTEDRSLDCPEGRVVRATSVLDWARGHEPEVGSDGKGGWPMIGRAVSGIRGWARRRLYFPDGQIAWYPLALAAGRRLLRRSSFDVVFSSSPPVTAHLIGRRLHRVARIPWVVEMRDLWSDWAWSGPRRRVREERIEHSILAEADEVVTVSPTYARVLSMRGARRVTVITNGFDAAPDEHPRRAEGTLVVYVGAFYPNAQDLRTSLVALGELRKSGELPGLRICFAGSIHPAARRIAVEAGLADDIESTGFIPYGRVLDLERRAHLLLLAGPPSAARPALKGNIAAKVFEYLASKRPILYCGAPDCDVAEVLRPFSGVRLVAPGDVAGARSAISSLLRENADCDDRDAGLRAYSRDAVVSGLARVLSRAASLDA